MHRQWDWSHFILRPDGCKFNNAGGGWENHNCVSQLQLFHSQEQIYKSVTICQCHLCLSMTADLSSLPLLILTNYRSIILLLLNYARLCMSSLVSNCRRVSTGRYPSNPYFILPVFGSPPVYSHRTAAATFHFKMVTSIGSLCSPPYLKTLLGSLFRKCKLKLSKDRALCHCVTGSGRH